MVTFEPSDPPRRGTVTIDGEPLPVGAAVPELLAARQDGDPSQEFWGAVAVLALRLVADRRIRPTVSPGGFDAWEAGPLDAAELHRVEELARAGAVPAGTVRGFLDAVADALPRSPGTAHPYAGTEPRPVPQSGIRISLRVDAPHDMEHTALTAVVQVHSLADPGLVADAGDVWAGRGTGLATQARTDTVLALRAAGEIWPPLRRLLQVAVPDQIVLDDEEIADLLGGGAARLAVAGVPVHWPRDLSPDLTARAAVGHGGAPHDLRGLFGGPGAAAPLHADWQLTLGGHVLTGAELDHLAEAHRPIVRLRDQWVLVDPAMARRARERDLKPFTPIDALGAALTGVTRVDGEPVEATATGWLAALRERIAAPDAGREPLRQPAGLAGSLRDYQLRGLRWLDRMTSLGLGCCLADDMGLGKTITVIALHLHRHEREQGGDPVGPTLVVCPASLVGNWEREIGRFAPGTPVLRYHGGGRSLGSGGTGFVLTTYATMRRDANPLAAHGWGLVVADEAQHVKNPRSDTARALRAIPAAARVALTGTPVENSLSDLWAILDWATPGLLGPLGEFRAQWAKPVEAGDTAAARRLTRLVAPFLLRRRKSDPGIAPELPSRTETDLPVALSTEQAGLYEAVVRESLAAIRGSDGMARRGQVFRMLTALKQICNHPAQYLKETDPVVPGRSGKVELLDELLDTITAEGGAALVFTQYVAMARLLEGHLTGRGHRTQLLHGGTPVRRRDEMVAAFQHGRAPVFLLSLQAAGTGLNLTRADHVIHVDRWWNPAVEDQATDRAHRIGQTRPVQVHRLIAEGTVEDRIAAMLRAKRHLAESVLDGGEAALSELSDEELADLVTLRG